MIIKDRPGIEENGKAHHDQKMSGYILNPLPFNITKFRMNFYEIGKRIGVGTTLCQFWAMLSIRCISPLIKKENHHDEKRQPTLPAGCVSHVGWKSAIPSLKAATSIIARSHTVGICFPRGTYSIQDPAKQKNNPIAWKWQPNDSKGMSFSDGQTDIFWSGDIGLCLSIVRLLFLLHNYSRKTCIRPPSLPEIGQDLPRNHEESEFI